MNAAFGLFDRNGNETKTEQCEQTAFSATKTDRNENRAVRNENRAVRNENGAVRNENGAVRNENGSSVNVPVELPD